MTSWLLLKICWSLIVNDWYNCTVFNLTACTSTVLIVKIATSPLTPPFKISHIFGIQNPVIPLTAVVVEIANKIGKHETFSCTCGPIDRVNCEIIFPNLLKDGFCCVCVNGDLVLGHLQDGDQLSTRTHFRT